MGDIASVVLLLDNVSSLWISSAEEICSACRCSEQQLQLGEDSPYSESDSIATAVTIPTRCCFCSDRCARCKITPSCSMSQLRRDVEDLKDRITSSELASKIKGWDVDGGSVTVRVKSEQQFVSCTIFFLSDSDYPSSPLMAMCPDDERLNSALESFSDHFEYGATLLEVVIKLLEQVNLDTAPLDPQQASDVGSQDDEGAVSEGDYSDTGQDMAETDNQVLYKHLYGLSSCLFVHSQEPAAISQELLEAVLKKVSSWDKAEAEVQTAETEALTAESNPAAAQSFSMEEQLAQKRQIFAPQEAYKMLARELKDMMLEPSSGVSVDAINNSVWQWDMMLTGFDAASPIAQVACCYYSCHTTCMFIYCVSVHSATFTCCLLWSYSSNSKHVRCHIAADVRG